MATGEELRKLPEKELQDKVKELREKIFHMRFKATTEPISNPAELRGLRKDVARVRTILRERQLQGAPKKRRLSRAARRTTRARAPLAGAGAGTTSTEKKA